MQLKLRRKNRTEERALTRQNVPSPMLGGDVAPASAGWGPTSTSSAAANITPRGALAIADAYACVRCLSDAAASLPLVAYRRTAQGRQRYTGPLAGLLDRPAPAVTQANLVGQLVAHLQLHGNAYVGKFRDAEGRVEQLALLHPERVVPELRAGRPTYVVLDGNGRRSEHGPEDIVHVRAMGTDGLVGLSPVRQCRVALGIASQLAEHAARFFENDATPRGILKLPSNDAEGVAEIADVWGSKYGGVRNAHRVAVIAGEVEFQPVSLTPEDAQFFEQRELSAREVARIFRVPPWMIGAGDGGSMTYSNVEQQAQAFVTFSLRPWLVLIEQAISADSDLCPPGVYCEFLVDALLRGDSKTRAEVYTAALNPVSGWTTREEVRRLENLDPEADRPAAAPPVATTNGHKETPIV